MTDCSCSSVSGTSGRRNGPAGKPIAFSTDLTGTGLAAVVISVLITGSRPRWMRRAVSLSPARYASIIRFIDVPARWETTQITP